MPNPFAIMRPCTNNDRIKFLKCFLNTTHESYLLKLLWNNLTHASLSLNERNLANLRKNFFILLNPKNALG